MAGLVPAIHALAGKREDVDARVKRGHDEQKETPSQETWTSCRFA
jgi:hypothetical protein